MVKQILTRKNIDINIGNYRGKTPLALAQELNYAEMVALLTAQNASMIPSNINIQDKNIAQEIAIYL